MSGNSQQFKDKLIHLRREFFAYLKQHHCKMMPIKNAALMLQKFMPMNPSFMKQWLQKSINSALEDGLNWEDFLICLQEELTLRDKVNKLKTHQQSITDISFHMNNIDEIIPNQRFSDIIYYIKKKQTNIIRIVQKAELLNLKLLVIVLDSEIIFYDCTQRENTTSKQLQDTKIIKSLTFHYNNVRAKIIKKQQLNTELYDISLTENFDKVNPISRRTDDCVFNKKQRKNNYISDQPKNTLGISKMQSSVCSDKSDFRRSVTQSIQLNRTISGAKNYKRSFKGTKPPSMAKIRSNDTKTAFKIMTQSSIQNSIEFMKAYKNSHQNFDKYIVVEKYKIQKEKLEDIKAPIALDSKYNYNQSLKQMKKQSNQLSANKISAQNQLFSRTTSKKYRSNNSVRALTNSSYKNTKKIRAHSINQTTVNNTSSQNLHEISGKQPSANAFKLLEMKILEIQSISFCDNYLLISLMNREVRLYKFRTTIHGFTQELIFEQNYPFIISNVVLYKSETRQLYNIAITKLCEDDRSLIQVFELSEKMQIQKQCFSLKLKTSPILELMLPLGIGGFSQNGYCFLLELNSPSKLSSERVGFQKYICDVDSGQKASLSVMKIHPNFIYLYLGTKNGEIYIYDRFSNYVKKKNKVSKFSIKQINLINGQTEIMFWDEGDRVGIINTENLLISNVTHLGVNSQLFHILEPYYSSHEFLMFSGRAMGVITLHDNLQKQFEATKPIKLFNRRRKLYQPKKKKQKQIVKDEFENCRKMIDYFEDGRCIIFICSDFQILIYDKNLKYIGSYFTLKTQTILQCVICRQNKFLAIIYEDNEIEIVNIYTQDLIFEYHSKQEIKKFFFCDSSFYFCGFLSKKASNLYIFSFPRIRLSNNNYNNLIFNKSISEINQITEDQYIRTSNSLEDTDKFSIIFYKGIMAYINLDLGKLIFFSKKIYSRSNSFNILEIPSIQSTMMTVVDVKKGQQSELLSILRSDGTVFVFSFTTKQLLYKLQSKNINKKMKPFSHYFDSFDNIVSIVQTQSQNNNQGQETKLFYRLYTVQIEQIDGIQQYSLCQKSTTELTKYWQNKQNYDSLKMVGQNLVELNSDMISLRRLYGPDAKQPNQIIIDISQI